MIQQEKRPGRWQATESISEPFKSSLNPQTLSNALAGGNADIATLPPSVAARHVMRRFAVSRSMADTLCNLANLGVAHV